MTVKRTSSGQHAAVQAHRKKMESIQDGVLADLEKLNRELDADLEATKDPRRDGDSEPPIDVVSFDNDEPTTIPVPKAEQ